MAGNMQRQMQDEMARFEAEISKSSSIPQSASAPPHFQHQIKALPKPPAPPQNLSGNPHVSTLFLPPQLQRAGVKHTAVSSNMPSTNVISVAGTAVISNKPVLYMPEKDAKSSAPVKVAPPPVKKIKTELKPVTSVLPQAAASVSTPSVLKAPSSTVGSATVKAGEDPKTVKQKKPKKFVRAAGGQVWQDDSLLDWDPNDYRIFCGDLGNDVTDEVLARVFGRFASFQRAKVVRDKRSNKTKGFGFVSFKDPQDFTRAMKELNGKYVGSRPIKLRKSNWKNRNIEDVKKRQKEKDALIGKRR